MQNSMKTNQIKTHYRRNLPHIQPIGSAFFVTFRLHGSIPNVKLLHLKDEYEQALAALYRDSKSLTNQLIYDERKRQFAKYDALLDHSQSGPILLQQPEIAKIVAHELHRFDGQLYDLVAYCIMSNHVHILIDTNLQVPEMFNFSSWESLDFEPLDKIMMRIKGASARYCNQQLGRAGKFWQRESYDHFVRDPIEFERIISYILDNPVKAGLVETWDAFPFTYLRGHQL